MRRERSLVRAVVVACALALISAGCGLGVSLGEAITAPSAPPTLPPTARPTTTPTAAASASAHCDLDFTTAIVDDAKGFTMCVPGSWVDLRAGDDGWVTLFGDHGSDVEKDVASGEIDHFIVPLHPRDQDTAVNLTIYVRSNDAHLSTAQAADAYAQVGRQGGATDIEVSTIGLPAGTASEITATQPRSKESGKDWLDAFVLVTPTTQYYLVYRCLLTSRSTYEAAFLSYATSFTLQP